MLFDLVLLTSCIVFGGIALVALRQRDAARSEAERRERLARIGASVDGLAHDLNNVLTSIPYLLEEALDLENEERRFEIQRELEQALNAGSSLLLELQKCVDGRLGAEGGSLCGVVRLVAAGLRFRGPKIVMELDGDMRYGPRDLELVERVREVMTEAVAEASAIERCVVRVELTDASLVIEHPKRAGSDEQAGLVGEIGSSWRLHRQVEPGDGDTLQVRLELARSPSQ
jgi:signal transduction histidine kinase